MEETKVLPKTVKPTILNINFRDISCAYTKSDCYLCSKSTSCETADTLSKHNDLIHVLVAQLMQRKEAYQQDYNTLANQGALGYGCERQPTTEQIAEIDWVLSWLCATDKKFVAYLRCAQPGLHCEKCEFLKDCYAINQHPLIEYYMKKLEESK
jgi:hypothetical protein